MERLQSWLHVKFICHFYKKNIYLLSVEHWLKKRIRYGIKFEKEEALKCPISTIIILDDTRNQSSKGEVLSHREE